MALIVEDGTGLADANSFVSLAIANSYCESVGYASWEEAVDEAKEMALRRSTAYLCNSYAWGGTKVNGRAQAVAFPRTGLKDKEGDAVASDSIPKEIEIACIELAVREEEEAGILNPDVIPAEGVKREKLSSMEIEYTNANTSVEASRPVITIVADLVAPFVKSNAVGAGSSTKFLQRA